MTDGLSGGKKGKGKERKKKKAIALEQESKHNKKVYR